MTRKTDYSNFTQDLINKLEAIIKPDNWKYKSGKRAGKLRPQSKKYLSARRQLYEFNLFRFSQEQGYDLRTQEQREQAQAEYKEARAEQIKERREREEEEREEEQQTLFEREKKQLDYVRAWAKVTYNKDKHPIFIESYIDGSSDSLKELQTELLEFIASNFSESVAAMTEIGFEPIKKPESSNPQIQYKHNLMGGWNTL